MKQQSERRPDKRSVLQPTGVLVLRNALNRLRDEGMSGAEAATQVVRQNFLEWIDEETQARTTSRALRLRIVKPS